MTYNPEATRSKLVEGIPFLFFTPSLIHHTAGHMSQNIIPPVTCHKNIVRWSHVKNIRCSSEAHPRLIRCWSHVTKTSSGHMSQNIRCSSDAHPGASHMSHSSSDDVKFIDYSRYAFLFNKKSFFFSLFFLLSSFGHCHQSVTLIIRSHITVHMSHSIHLD